MGRIVVGSLVGVFSSLLAAAPGHAQDSSFTQVRCDDGQGIQAAVDNTRPGGAVEVSGTCAGMVEVRNDGVEIYGVGGAVLQAGASNFPIVVLAQNVTIRGLQVLGGGIMVTRGGSAHLSGNTISTAAVHGVNVSFNAFASIETNTIDLSAFGGVVVEHNSSAIVSGNTVSNSGSVGIGVDLNSSVLLASFGGGANTLNLNQPGVSCGSTGTLNVQVAQNFGGGPTSAIDPDCQEVGLELP